MQYREYGIQVFCNSEINMHCILIKRDRKHILNVVGGKKDKVLADKTFTKWSLTDLIAVKTFCSTLNKHCPPTRITATQDREKTI